MPGSEKAMVGEAGSSSICCYSGVQGFWEVWVSESLGLWGSGVLISRQEEASQDN